MSLGAVLDHMRQRVSNDNEHNSDKLNILKMSVSLERGVKNKTFDEYRSEEKT